MQVRHKDCAKGEWNTTQFCDLSHVNSAITSCGPVHVSSWLPTASDQADRFLVSYQSELLNKEREMLRVGLMLNSTR